MASIVDIANNALNILGASTISSLTEDTKNARICASHAGIIACGYVVGISCRMYTVVCTYHQMCGHQFAYTIRHVWFHAQHK